MKKGNLSQEFRVKNIYKTKSCFLKEIEQKELMTRKHNKV